MATRSRSFLRHGVLFLFWYFSELEAREVAKHLYKGSSGGLIVKYGRGYSSPSALQILINDKNRVDSINAKISNSHSTSTFNAKRSVPVGSNPFEAGVYLIEVGLGTPQKKFNLLLDTGSSVTWVLTQSPSGCKKKHHIFNPAESSTFSNTSCAITSGEPYEIPYADKSYSEGYYGCDTLTVPPNIKYPNFVIGCGQKSTNFCDTDEDGVLGLTSNGQAIKSLGAPFCYCLPTKTDSELGYLHFGKDALKHCKTDNYISLRTDNKYYYVNLIGITVGNTRLNISSDFNSNNPKTIIDSGTVITRLPPLVYAQLRSEFDKTMSKYPSAKPDPDPDVNILDTCYNLEKYGDPTVPSVVMHFDNSDMVLDKDTVLFTGDGQVYCLAFSDKEDDGYNIIGSGQQKKLNILYDIKNKKLGFGKGNCGI